MKCVFLWYLVNTLWDVHRFVVDKVCVRMCSHVIDILHMRCYNSGGEFIILLHLIKCAGCKGDMCVCDTLYFFLLSLKLI